MRKSRFFKILPAVIIPLVLASFLNAGITGSSSSNSLLGTVNTWTQTNSFNQITINGGNSIVPSSSDNGSALGGASSYFRYGYLSRALAFGLVKTISDNTASAIIEIDVNDLRAVGGLLVYNVSADNATDEHTRAGSVPFTFVQKSGTATCQLGTPSDSFARTDGASTLTLTISAGAGNPNTCRITMTSDSSFNVSSIVETLIIGSIDIDGAGVSVTP